MLGQQQTRPEEGMVLETRTEKIPKDGPTCLSIHVLSYAIVPILFQEQILIIIVI